jgi:hypothetical protein
MNLDDVEHFQNCFLVSGTDVSSTYGDGTAL